MLVLSRLEQEGVILRIPGHRDILVKLLRVTGGSRVPAGVRRWAGDEGVPRGTGRHGQPREKGKGAAMSEKTREKHKGLPLKVAKILRGVPPEVAVQAAGVAAAGAFVAWRQAEGDLPSGTEVESEIRRLALAMMEVLREAHQTYRANREGKVCTAGSSGNQGTAQEAG